MPKGMGYGKSYGSKGYGKAGSTKVKTGKGVTVRGNKGSSKKGY